MRHPTCWFITLPLLLALVAARPALSEASSDLIVVGYVENAWFEGNSIAFTAKLDTGAKSSSINAPQYEEFRRDERDWVRFEIINSKGRTLKVERPIVRFVRIRRSGTASGRRPVILLKVCVAGKTAEVEFNLGDREEMNYQVLIGRTFLAGRMLVNSGETFMASKLCRKV